jgi:hypothetical protein
MSTLEVLPIIVKIPLKALTVMPNPVLDNTVIILLLLPPPPPLPSSLSSIVATPPTYVGVDTAVPTNSINVMPVPVIPLALTSIPLRIFSRY